MKVLLVGGGAREHAVAWGLARSARLSELLCAPGNGGTAELGSNLPVAVEDTAGLVAAAVAQRVDLVVVGPEAPLAAGLVEALEAKGIRAFGPTQAAAQIEASKRYAKSLMADAGVPHAPGRAYQDAACAHAYIDHAFEQPPVIKANGLASGKGVIVPATMEEAHVAVDELLGGRFGEASRTVVIERRLAGLEASAMAFVDGETVAPMPLACDYKRVGDGDTGPNTGGMGAYSPPGFLPNAAVGSVFATIHEPSVEALSEAQRPFRGVLYAGLMVSEGAPSVLEFNCRLGDPEAQVVLPQLRTDLLEVLLACCEGRLADQRLDWEGGARVGVVLASGGYPGRFEDGKPIRGLDEVDEDVLVFQAGTRVAAGGGLATDGGRVLTVVGRGPTLAAARERAYDNAARIEFEGRTYRSDIALREV